MQVDMWLEATDHRAEHRMPMAEPGKEKGWACISPTACGEMSWQNRALKRMRTSGKVTQARYCRGRLGCMR